MSYIHQDSYPVSSIEIADLKKRIAAANRTLNGWQDVCDALARCAGGVGTALLAFDPNQRGHGLVSSQSLKEVAKAYVEEGWFQKDLRQDAIPTMVRRGYCLDSDVDGIETLVKLPYYANFLARFELGGFCALHFQIEDVDWAASIQFGASRFEPRPGFTDYVDEIRAALSEAATMRMTKARDYWKKVRHFYRATGSELIPIDQFGCEVSWLLEGFQMDAVDALAAENWIESARDKTVLDGVITDHVRKWLVGSEQLPPAVVLTSVDGLTLSCAYLKTPDLVNFFAFGVAGFLAFSRVEPVASPAVGFANRIGLTPAETRVVKGLTDGWDIKEIAGNLGLAEGTVRQYLKSVFRKSDTKTQHQLVAKVYRDAINSI